MKLTLSRIICLLSSGSSLLSVANAFGVVSLLPSHHLASTTTTTTTLSYGSEDGSWDNNNNNNNNNKVVEVTTFESPVLQQLYPALLKHKETYGNPNIPLGSKEGRQCQTLRRLHIQNKLTGEEVAWLESLGFTFHSLEDVYKYADFDEMFHRLIKYEAAHPNNHFQVPKKCPEDPELGAWVTGIRRLEKEGVNPEHERRLDDVGFAWKSTRKCGSKFMNQYREWTVQVTEKGLESVLDDENSIKWIKAQQEALKRGSLSQTRVHYMSSLFGDSWTTM